MLLLLLLLLEYMNVLDKDFWKYLCDSFLIRGRIEKVFVPIDQFYLR